MKLKKYKYYYLLGALILGIFALNLLWAAIDSRPPHWDMARHLWTSLQYKTLLDSGSLIPLLQQYFYYPPLLYLATIPTYLIFGTSELAALSVNLLFLSIFSLSVFFIARKFYDTKTSLVAVVLANSFPMVVTQFKEYQLDAPLMAMSALFLALVIRRPFSSYQKTIILGLAIGFGMLLKWTFAAVIIFPLLLALTEEFILRRQKIGTSGAILDIFKKLALMSMIAYVVTSPWYVANIQQLRIDFQQNGVRQAQLEGDPVIGSLGSNVYYLKNIVINQLHLIYSLLALIGAGLVLYSKKRIYQFRYILVYLISIILIFTFLPNKDARYTMALLPAIAVISLSWILLPVKSNIKNLSLVGLTAFSVFYFIYISFGIPNINARSINEVPIIKSTGYIIGPPLSEKWYQEEVARFASTQKDRSLSYNGSDTIWLNSWGWHYYAKKFDLKLGEKEPSVLAVKSIEALPAPKNYELNAQYSLPDGSKLNVFVKIQP